jgi:predicted transcriptional regulator
VEREMAKLTSIDDKTELWAVNKEKKEAEPLDGFFVYHANRPKLKNKDFFFMFQQSLKMIASCEELNGTDLKVFMFLLSELDFENYIRVTQKRITEHTKIKQQNVSTSLTKLTKLNIIEKVTLDNLKAYRLNPSYAWKGKISEFQKEEKDRKKRAASEAKIIQLKPTVTKP